MQGIVYKAIGLNQRAAAMLRKALELMPGNADAHRELAELEGPGRKKLFSLIRGPFPHPLSPPTAFGLPPAASLASNRSLGSGALCSDVAYRVSSRSPRRSVRGGSRKVTRR